MIDRFISFIVYFPANLHFYIGEYEFYGLCLKPGDNFPWSNRKERNVFLNELAEREDAEGMDRFLYWYKAWYLNRFHRRFSWRFILHILCYCALFFCILALLAQSFTVLLATVSCTLMLLTAKFLTHRSISRLYFNLNMVRLAVDMLRQNG